jgi:hypothetical protein
VQLFGASASAFLNGRSKGANIFCASFQISRIGQKTLILNNFTTKGAHILCRSHRKRAPVREFCDDMIAKFQSSNVCGK